MNDSWKTAIITGCDSGIGRSLCDIFLSHGYSLIIAYLRNNPFQGNKTDQRENSGWASFYSVFFLCRES